MLPIYKKIELTDGEKLLFFNVGVFLPFKCNFP